MTESTQVKTPKKKVSKPKKPADHPSYSSMVKDAVTALKERGGSSRQALLKYVMANYKVGDNPKAINARLKTALKNGVQSGILKQAKGTGAAGSFRLGEKKAEKKPAAKKTAVEKPKKVKTPIKKATKKSAGDKKAKPAAKKTKSPKKTAKPKKAKTPKKAKVAAKPKKVKKRPKRKSSRQRKPKLQSREDPTP
ncbi:histone H1-delta-like [Gigantopelta aegis]|uniref:histone H1-delta-like n=1 Tax=Gigantopelta aegis TaxID=1735272 RepID=UPI001B88CA92|nr:histone H1-delta-like [Gigantopelta aegis]